MIDEISPNQLGITCPDCSSPVQDVGIESGVCPETGEPSNYVLYYCEESVDLKNYEDSDCYGVVKVYDTGYIVLSGEDESSYEVRSIAG